MLGPIGEFGNFAGTLVPSTEFAGIILGPPKVASFTGFRAIIYQPRMAEDAEACEYVIEDANGENNLHGPLTLADKIPRAQESHHALHTARTRLRTARYTINVR